MKAATFLVLNLLLPRSDLPSTQELIRQTAAACAEYEKEYETGPNTLFFLSSLAQAYAYSGDYAGAGRNVERLAGMQKLMTLLSCAKIRYQQTGALADLPDRAKFKDFDEYSLGYIRSETAKMLVEAGRIAESRKYLPYDEHERLSAYRLAEFDVFLAQHHFDRGELSEAASALEEALRMCKKIPARHKQIEWAEAMVRLWLQLDNRNRAVDVRNTCVVATFAWTRKAKPDRHMAECWAHLGQIHAMLGDRDRARHTLRQAVEIADAADLTDEKEYPAHMRAGFYAQTLGKIGGRQLAAGFQSDARETSQKALARLERIEDDAQRDTRLWDFVKSHTEFGELDTALRTVDRIKTAYWKALSYCECAKRLIAEDKSAAVGELLENALKLLDIESAPRNTGDLLTRIAEVKAKAGDLAGARQLLRKATMIARALKDTDVRFWTVEKQIRVGMFDDAYATIITIEDLDTRLLHLTDLTCEVAKREAQGKTNRAK